MDFGFVFLVRPRIFFSRRHLLDVIDLVIIVLSFIANTVTLSMEQNNTTTAFKILIFFRCIRIFMFCRFINEKRNMEKAARKVRYLYRVPQKKRAFIPKKFGFCTRKKLLKYGTWHIFFLTPNNSYRV